MTIKTMGHVRLDQRVKLQATEALAAMGLSLPVAQVVSLLCRHQLLPAHSAHSAYSVK